MADTIQETIQGTIEIADAADSLRITESGNTRYVLKRHIREISLIRSSVVKLDTGDALNNIYFEHSEVSIPQTQSAEALRDVLNEMLRDECINQINQQISEIAISIDAINSEIFVQASIEEQINTGDTYYGYALPGSQTSEPVWAIRKASANNGVSTNQWADGNKDMNKVWDNRRNLQYS